MGELVATLDKKVNELFQNRLKSGKTAIETKIEKEKEKVKIAKTKQKGKVSYAGRMDNDQTIIEEEETDEEYYSDEYGSQGEDDNILD